MRLHSIAIEGFRAFTEKAEIDLAADVIILHGPNGVGKTSLLDAILWVFTGEIQRFGSSGGPISIYAREGIARVSLQLATDAGPVRVTRSTDGVTTSLRLTCNGDELDGPVADARLIELFLPHLHDRASAPSVLSKVVTRGIYLQQDLVRQFIESDTPQERFSLLSEVIGAGVILELQQTLERSRLQWARSTNASRAETLVPLEKRYTEIKETIARLEDDTAAGNVDARRESETLFKRVISLLGPSRLALQEPPTSSGQLDRLLKELTAERAQMDRELAQARAFQEETDALVSASRERPSSLEAWRSEEGRLTEELGAVEQEVSSTLNELDRLRTEQVREQDKLSRLAAMARVALDELTETCPVCQQRHDIEKTRAHLENLLNAGPTFATPLRDSEATFSKLNERRFAIQKALDALRSQIRSAELEEKQITTRADVLQGRLADIGISLDERTAGKLRTRIDRLSSNLSELSEIIRQGESLSLAVIRLGEQRRRTELIEELAALESKTEETRRAIERQEVTHALSGQIIDGLRGASLEVTRKQVASVAPLFQRIYSRIDPHPTFRVTDIVTALERGKGLLRVGISDPQQGSQFYDAIPILSSSQLNSLAVSLFLALNLALPTVRLDLTILDDPLQSLDSINLLGLVDVLRRFKANRQIVVSTHEERFLGLLQRKLRPVRPGDRMLTITFEEWSRSGPSFKPISVIRDEPEPTVLAA